MADEKKEESKKLISYKPQSIPRDYKQGYKVTQSLTLSPDTDQTITTIGLFIKAGDTTITIGEGLIPMEILAFRVVAGQVQMKARWRDQNGTLTTKWELPSIAPKEYYANVITANECELNEKEIKVFCDSDYGDGFTWPQHHREQPLFDIDEVVLHKPQPYKYYGKHVQPPIGLAKIVSYAPTDKIWDYTPQYEIEPNGHSLWHGGFTYAHQLRKRDEEQDPWDITFLSLASLKLQQAQDAKKNKYLRKSCLNPDTLPLHLSKSSFWWANQKGLARYESLLPITENNISDQSRIGVKDALWNLARVGILPRMRAKIGGDSVSCTFSDSNSKYHWKMTGYMCEIFEKLYLDDLDIEFMVTDYGILNVTFNLSEYPVFLDLFGAEQMKCVMAQGTICSVSEVEDITISYNTKKQALMVRVFSFVCE